MFADDKTKHVLEQCVLVEIREMRCEQALAAALKSIKKGPVDCLRERKSAAWKVAVAAHLERTTQASNRWLTEQLHMGSPVAVSHYVGELRRTAGEAREIPGRLTKRLKV